MKTFKFALSAILIHFLICNTHINAQTKETDPVYLKSNYGIWLTEESKHFIINYRDSSFRAKKIDKNKIKQILIAQEVNLVTISKKTGIDTSLFNSLKKINIWLFVDFKEQLQITKLNVPAFSIYPYWSLYFFFDIANNRHELAHLISQEYWGWFGSGKFQMLVCEGFANYMDEWGIKQGDFAKSAKKVIGSKKDFIQQIIQNPYGSVGGLFVNPYKQNIVVSSAFVKFLIDTYGMEKLKLLWKELKEDDATFGKIYGHSFETLKNDFYKFVNNLD